MRTRKFFGLFLFFSGLISVSYLAQPVAALEGARSATVGNDVFLGGSYIELGIRGTGRFGTTESRPAGFFGTDARTSIGMSTDPDGFNNGLDIRYDFFLPGSPEERWVIGYYDGGSQVTSSNLAGYTNTVTDTSSGDTLSAISLGTHNDKLQVSQNISFGVEDKFFLNEVTLTNVGNTTLETVRYMRSFDPDNTVDEGGSYDTQNEVKLRYEEDGSEAVEARTYDDADPVFVATGSRSPILFYSSDSRARVSIFGFGNGDPFVEEAYDTPTAKGSSIQDDIAITIAFDVGDLQPGDSATVRYYTSLDNRDFSDVIGDIEEDDNDNSGGGDAAAPTLSVNKTLDLPRGDSRLISSSFLKFVDDTSNAANVRFFIATSPANGVITKNGQVLGVGNSFTQAEIDAGIILYTHNNTATTTDSFKFRVRDASKAQTALQTFNFYIAPKSITPITPPPVDENPEPQEEPETEPEIIVIPNPPVVAPIKEDPGTNLLDVLVKIVDDEGEPLTNTPVFIPELDKEVFTDENGDLILTDIPPGEYTYIVELNGKTIRGTFSILGAVDVASQTSTSVSTTSASVEAEEDSVTFNYWLCCCLPLLLLLPILLLIYRKRKEKQEEKPEATRT